LARYALAGWDLLSVRLEDRGYRVLSEPIDLQVGMKLAQFIGNREVAPGVAETDWRGDVEGAPAARPGAHPRRRRLSPRLDELAKQEVCAHRIA
jgi:hypothetical protein